MHTFLHFVVSLQSIFLYFAVTLASCYFCFTYLDRVKRVIFQASDIAKRLRLINVLVIF
jgi:hypothetical protein